LGNSITFSKTCIETGVLFDLDILHNQEVREDIKDGQICACDFATNEEDCGREAVLQHGSAWFYMMLTFKCH